MESKDVDNVDDEVDSKMNSVKLGDEDGNHPSRNVGDKEQTEDDVAPSKGSGRAEAKQDDSGDEKGRPDEKTTRKPPTLKAAASREGYTQTYIVKASSTKFREVLFRCGNWCYMGSVDLSIPDFSIRDLPFVVPALQKQQDKLRYLSEWSKIPKDNPFHPSLTTLYDVIEGLEDILTGEEVEKALTDGLQSYNWIEDGKSYFELQVESLGAMKDIEFIANKSYTRGLILITMYFQNSYFCLLQDGTGDQPLLDVRFPDISQRMGGFQLKSFAPPVSSTSSTLESFKTLLIWQLPDKSSTEDIPKALAIKLEDATGEAGAYTQTYLISKPRKDGEKWQQTLRNVMFRFGSWCYSGTVDVGTPGICLPDITWVMPILRKQQSLLSFYCEVSKVPAVSSYAPAITRFARDSSVLRQEILNSEKALLELADRMDNMGLKAKIMDWLDGKGDNFFEFQTSGIPEYQDLELIASRTYTEGVVMVTIYYQDTFYVTLQDGTGEQLLLDSKFPDVSSKSCGYQIQSYHAFMHPSNVSRILVWEATTKSSSPSYLQEKEKAAPKSQESKGERSPSRESKGSSSPKKAPQRDEDRDQAPAEEKVNDIRKGILTKEEPTSASKNHEDEEKAASKPFAGKAPRLKVALPHHLAPLKSSTVKEKLVQLGASGGDGEDAPWDIRGKPRLESLHAK